MKHIQKYLKLYVFAFLTILTILVGSVGAKYVYETEGKNLFSAKEFYFESNLLRSEETKYLLNPTASSISFTLTNAIDELRKSDDVINYTVTIYDDNQNVTSQVFDSENSTVGLLLSNENDNYSIVGQLSNESVNTNNISLMNLVRGKTYTVTATGKAGYVKTLNAQFTVSDTDKIIWKHLDVKDEYVLLTVWTENLAGKITINIPAGLVPDGTDTVLSRVTNYNEKDNKYDAKEFEDKINFGKVYSSHVYRFFIDEDKNYTVKDFDVYQKGEINILAGTGNLK